MNRDLLALYAFLASQTIALAILAATVSQKF